MSAKSPSPSAARKSESSDSPLLRVAGLSKSYHDGERELHVLSGADFVVGRGEAVAIVGMSGAGKSTLLHLIGALDRPDAGSILFEGEDVAKLPKPRANSYRNLSIGFVFQFHHLLPEFSAIENAMMPALLAGRTRAEAREAAGALLAEMELSDRATHRPGKLSGGEQQRVALARALVNSPALVLADEPTGNLDPGTARKVIDVLWRSTVGRGRSLVIVTHEPAIAEKADRALVLMHRKLENVGRADVAARMRGMARDAE